MGEEALPKRREHGLQACAVQYSSRWPHTEVSTSPAASLDRRLREGKHTLGFNDSAPKAEYKASSYQLLILTTSETVTVWTHCVK